MTSSALNEWNINPDPETLAYHRRQWDSVYGSTKDFARFIEPWAFKSKTIIDLGCGAGASTAYIADHFPNAKLSGWDISPSLISIARSRPEGANVAWGCADILDFGDTFGVDGVISLQTFSWMKDIEAPLARINRKIGPKWLAFSSLFYEGDISCQIIVDEPKRPRQSYYNIYSIPRTIAFMKERGYRVGRIKPFEIGVDLPKPSNLDLMKTYTLAIEDGGRLQCSGPLVLPWYFMCFEKQ